MAHLAAPVTIKRYAHRRLSIPAAGRHVTPEDLAGMAEDETDFVPGGSNGEDIAPSILNPTIIERARHG
jgi:polyhydroxyalkanoate synthesis regulator protein